MRDDKADNPVSLHAVARKGEQIVTTRISRKEVPLIETKRKQKIQLIFLLIYIFTVLWFTVLSRPTG